MREGISTNRSCGASAECLMTAGKQFVFRYHSRTTTMPQKRISPREAALLARAGMEIATVYQDRARNPEDFGLERGRLDGASAQTFAAQIGQPAGSAIYFAVDADFSRDEINRFVLPYFEGVRQGLDAAAGGTSGYELGVYGSGLTCATVRDREQRTRFAWLAEATGWRGSADYTNWDVRQFVNRGETLCDLGTAFERCRARDSFGQFQPIGFDVGAADGELMRVTAAQLNLRRAPTTSSTPALAILPEGQIVRVLGRAADPWLRVRTTLGGSDVIGYASGRFLAAIAGAGGARAIAPQPVAPQPVAPQPVAPAIPPVHFRENDPLSRRASPDKRAQPLGEPGRPARDGAASPSQRVAQLGAIVDWLAVEASARYQRTSQATFCNVYAADFCYLASAYLPRTWWTESALVRIARGEAPQVAYGSTIREMRADDLFAWLVDAGPMFGWRRAFDATALQAAANDGGIGVICADREAEGLAGHISIVVPETSTAKARRDVDRNVVTPLQSQAGASNFRYSTAPGAQALWWERPEYRAWGFFIHE